MESICICCRHHHCFVAVGSYDHFYAGGHDAAGQFSTAAHYWDGFNNVLITVG